jgi:hypothetical protein
MKANLGEVSCEQDIPILSLSRELLPLRCIMEHWECVICGLRSHRKESSPCPESKARFLKVHDWEDAFELAYEEGVLTWEYESRDDFMKAQKTIRDAGWMVDQVTEITRPVGAARVGLLGPAAWLARPKGMFATLHRLKEQSRPRRRTYRRQQRRTASVEPALDGFTLEDGKYKAKKAESPPPDGIAQDSEDDLYHRADGDLIYRQERP